MSTAKTSKSNRTLGLRASSRGKCFTYWENKLLFSVSSMSSCFCIGIFKKIGDDICDSNKLVNLFDSQKYQKQAVYNLILITSDILSLVLLRQTQVIDSTLIYLYFFLSRPAMPGIQVHHPWHTLPPGRSETGSMRWHSKCSQTTPDPDFHPHSGAQRRLHLAGQIYRRVH